jgi:pimeloyl-ACP methyl ester carboxylesterase
MWCLRIPVLLVAACAFATDAGAQPGAVPGPCEEGWLPSGARSKMCVPTAGWNGQLIVYAHGYVPDIPGVFGLDFYDRLPDGTDVAPLVQGLGFAYATTSYRQNGLAIVEGVDDVRELVAAFTGRVGRPTRAIMAGASEGGLVSALLAERSPGLFAGALAVCGPIGSFTYQLRYLGDFRVLFDYFFPGVLAGSVVDVSTADQTLWLTGVSPAAIRASLLREPAKAIELMKTAKAAYDPADFSTVIGTTLGVLQYNILGAPDLQRKLGGSPFDNRLRWYFGSANDLRLNLSVRRFAADPAAVLAVRPYETSGRLTVPLVAPHTTADEIVPVAHELLYFLKVRPSGRGRFLPLPVSRYGHCNLTRDEILLSLGILLAQP